jgi:hypothetical protein
MANLLVKLSFVLKDEGFPEEKMRKRAEGIVGKAFYGWADIKDLKINSIEKE